jgi:hypothetical protein
VSYYSQVRRSIAATNFRRASGWLWRRIYGFNESISYNVSISDLIILMRANLMNRDEFDRLIIANCDAVAQRLGLPCMTPGEADALWRRYVEGRNRVLFEAAARGEASASSTPRQPCHRSAPV